MRGVVEHPLLALFVGHVDSVDADAFVELLLKAEKFVEFVGLCHRENIISRSCRKSLLFWRKRQSDSLTLLGPSLRLTLGDGLLRYTGRREHVAEPMEISSSSDC